MTDEQLLKEVKQVKVNQEKLERKFEEIQNQLDKAVGGSQPSGDNQLDVWDEELEQPGDPVIVEVIKKAKKTDDSGLRRIPVGKIEDMIDRSRTRTLDVMRELARKHDRLKFKNLGGNKGSYLYYKGDPTDL